MRPLSDQVALLILFKRRPPPRLVLSAKPSLLNVSRYKTCAFMGSTHKTTRYKRIIFLFIEALSTLRLIKSTKYF